MKRTRLALLCASVVIAFTATIMYAQSPAPAGGGAQPKNFGSKDAETPEDPRQWRYGEFLDFPTWKVSPELPNDVFTFARVRYNSYGGGRGYGRRRGGGNWMTDYPDADLNFSYRLQQLTAMQVNPKGAVVDIDAEQLKHHPFIYLIEPGNISLSDVEAKVLREYLLNGGFLMVDDFWGYDEWDTFHTALKQIFPEREPKELPVSHEIFHIVFDLKVKPQIPSVGAAMAGRSRGITHEWGKAGSEEVHYKGVFDDKGRMMMIICHNTDLGDGWEEEGTDPWYFREFSEKYAYPLGINIIFYAMTH
jgi:hypothetical protein